MISSRIRIAIDIDGKEYTCQPGETVLDVARRNNVYIPTLCYNPFLFTQQKIGACRMCVVEILAGGRPGLQSSCTLPVSTGLKVSTKSEAVYNARKDILELILSEHTFDCWNCSVSGDCRLSKISVDLDIESIPVCSECSNQRESCLLSKGELCLGPITHRGCGAYCANKGYSCVGCLTTIQNVSVLKNNIRAYKTNGISGRDILSMAKLFALRGAEVLEKAMREEGML